MLRALVDKLVYSLCDRYEREPSLQLRRLEGSLEKGSGVDGRGTETGRASTVTTISGDVGVFAEEIHRSGVTALRRVFEAITRALVVVVGTVESPPTVGHFLVLDGVSILKIEAHHHLELTRGLVNYLILTIAGVIVVPSALKVLLE